jgi:hypothetical protein
VDIAAKFDSTGHWRETESAIKKSRLPRQVRATIASKFRGYRIIETQTVERFDAKRLLYEVHLKGSKEIVKVQLEGDGTLLTNSAKPGTGM